MCVPLCAVCRTPGRVCAEQARWEAQELNDEETDRCHDEFRAASWSSPNRPEGEYVDGTDELFSTRTWADALDAIWKTR
jgi:hypothetical protein